MSVKTVGSDALRSVESEGELREALRSPEDAFRRAGLVVRAEKADGGLELSPKRGRQRDVVAVVPRDGGFRIGWVGSEQVERLGRSALRVMRLDPQSDRHVAVARKLGLEPAIEGQIDGYWFAPNEEPPARPPPYRPELSLLPPRDLVQPLEVGCSCLLLVELDSRWCPLSERAVTTYWTTYRIEGGEQWTFAYWLDARKGRSVRRLLSVGGLKSTSARFVKEHYDLEAVQRMRTDAKPVLVHVEPLEGASGGKAGGK